MASATDIITYIGVPLAVLGVLPILYTFGLAIITQRRIRATLLRHGHKPIRSTHQADGFSIRSSPMTSLIEIEFPRYTIAPLSRNHEDYWKPTNEGQEDGEEHHYLLARAESTLSMIEEGRVQGFLRGGSWRAFHWKKLIVGKRMYRIQYEDELREPPAEIDFSELVNFLLDWGAVPDSMGWEKLRTGGLWTPSGTILLRKPDLDEDDLRKKRAVDWVLRTGVPDESDGVLSIAIRWTKTYDSSDLGRGPSSLPPGWGRLVQPKAERQTADLAKSEKADSQGLIKRIEEHKAAMDVCINSTSFRFQAEENRVSRLLWEDNNVETGFISEPWRTHESTSATTWFSSAASGLMSRKQSGALWGCEIPQEIVAFARKETVPCGVLVMLGLMTEMDAPQWSSEVQRDHRVNVNTFSETHHQRYLARRAAEQLEASMPPEQARIHKMNREDAERRQSMNDVRSEAAARVEREERRCQEAIASPKLGNQAVAEALLAWLIEKGEVGKEWTVEQLAEAVMYLMVVDQSESGEARKVVEVLDEWMTWNQAGGMKRQQVTFLGSRKVAFCFAASLLAVIQQAALSSGKASADMMECLKLWRKVRLG